MASTHRLLRGRLWCLINHNFWRADLDLRVVHLQCGFLRESEYIVYKFALHQRLTCRDDEKDKISPKKSSALGASGDSGFSPKNVSMDLSSASKELDIFVSASTLALTCCAKGYGQCN